ncbi:MAG: DegV family protein [Bacillota bacterium]|nr:DegV family protein [Bacillota bacterium]
MREKIALLADSACDISTEICQKMKINIIPLKVVYPEASYLDRVDIQPDEVYSRMPAEIPTTSMPSLDEIKTAVDRIRDEGFTHVLAITLSSKFSGTFQAINVVANEIEDMKISTFDSKTLSYSTGWMVLEAAQSIADGMNMEKILKNLEGMRSKVNIYYVLETLEYLRRGGRIGAVSAMLGEFLHFKPIIAVDDEGKYFIHSKTRGRKKSIERLMNIVEQKSQEKPIKLAVLQGGAKKEGEKMLEHLRKLPNIQEIVFSDITPTLGVHTGPGLLGVSICEV